MPNTNSTRNLRSFRFRKPSNQFVEVLVDALVDSFLFVHTIETLDKRWFVDLITDQVLSHYEKGSVMFRKTNSNLTFDFDENAGVVRIELFLRNSWVEVDSVFKHRAPDETDEWSVVDHGFHQLPAHTQIHSGDRCVDLREGSPDLICWVPTTGKTDVTGGKPIPVIPEPMDSNVLLDLHGDGRKGVGLSEPTRVLINDPTANRFIDVVIHLMFEEARLEFDSFTFCFQKLHLVIERDLKDPSFAKAA